MASFDLHYTTSTRDSPNSIDSVMGDIFPFDRLAPELRINIFEKYLLATSPIHITYTSGRRVVRGGTYRLIGVVKGRKITNTYFSPAFPNRKPSNLLLLNKPTHAEASAVLYGQNTFVFVHDIQLQNFAKMIATNGQYLRHIELSCDDLQAYLNTSVLQQHISPMAQIRTATFCLIDSRLPSDELPAHLYMCVHALVSQGADNKARKERFAAVRITQRDLSGWHRDLSKRRVLESASSVHKEEKHFSRSMVCCLSMWTEWADSHR